MSDRRIIEEFIKLTIAEYSLDQVALLSNWTYNAEDKIEYLTSWLGIGTKTAEMIEDYDIDVLDLLDDVLLDKKREAQEAADEEYDIMQARYS